MKGQHLPGKERGLRRTGLVAGWEGARSRRGRTLGRIPAGPKSHRARSRINRLHRAEGEDATAPPEKAEPPDDDLVGMVSVQAVAHVLELAERASLARADVVAARRGKQAPEPRCVPVGMIFPARCSSQRFSCPKGEEDTRRARPGNRSALRSQQAVLGAWRATSRGSRRHLSFVFGARAHPSQQTVARASVFSFTGREDSRRRNSLGQPACPVAGLGAT